MSYADDVRRFVKDKIVDPARKRGENQIVIRAGDVHSAMNYHSRMPLVCAALGANKFPEIAEVERVSITGPTNGANAEFTFRIK
jgi:5-methylcytosine-specific restriction enzyme B